MEGASALKETLFKGSERMKGSSQPPSRAGRAERAGTRPLHALAPVLLKLAVRLAYPHSTINCVLAGTPLLPAFETVLPIAPLNK